MRFTIQILFILVLAAILELFLPWWSIALAAFAGGLALKSNFNFVAGFIAIAVLWLAKIMIVEFSAAAPLAEKVAHIFTLPGKTSLIIVTCIIGGVVGGLGAVTGALLTSRK